MFSLLRIVVGLPDGELLSWVALIQTNYSHSRLMYIPTVIVNHTPRILPHGKKKPNSALEKCLVVKTPVVRVFENDICCIKIFTILLFSK